MAENAGLMRAIVAEPDSDEPRLVYADWVESHGDLERAEFIRLQCQSARLPVWHADRQRLVEQASKIYVKHKKAWTLSLQGTAVRVYEFRRGFLEHIVLNGKNNFEMGRQVIEAFPTIRCLKINKVRNCFDRLLAADWINPVSSLNLTANQIGAKRVRQLVESSNLQQLTALNLKGNGIKSAGMQSLFQANELPGLKKLSVSGADLKSVPVEAIGQLLNGPTLANLEWLAMSTMGWSVDKFQAVNELVSEADGSNLRYFEFGDGEYDNEIPSTHSLEPFCNSTFFRNLEHLKITSVLTDDQFSTICNHPASTSLCSFVSMEPTERQVEILLESDAIWENLKFIHLGELSPRKFELLQESPKCARLDWLGMYASARKEKLLEALAEKHRIQVAGHDYYSEPGDFERSSSQT